jgi:hypothetical protein
MLLCGLGFCYALIRMKPVPIAYVNVSSNDGKYDRDPPKDPKAEIKLGSAGMGPMFIHTLSILSHGKPVQQLGDFLHSPTVDVCRESTNVYKSWKGSTPFHQASPITLVTVRPKDVMDAQFGSVVHQQLLDHKVQIQVTCSASPYGIVHWLTKETRVLDIMPE